MKTPKPAHLLLAAEWLDENEGEDEERLPMRAVAEWLREMATKAANQQAFKEVAKERGVSVRQIRSMLKGKNA